MSVFGERVPAAWARQLPPGAWDDAIALLQQARDVERTTVLVCPEDPDSDALGSMLALLLALERHGVRAQASWGAEPFRVPASLATLPGVDRLTPPDALPVHPDLLVVLDAASRERLGGLAPLVDRAGTVLVLNHHATNDWGDDAHVALAAPTAAATAMVVEELLARWGVRLDRELAACLYVGLVADTGRFQYPNTDRATLELASRLLDHDIAHDRLSQQVFDSRSFGFLKILSRVLDRATLLPAWNLVYSWVTDRDRERLGVAPEETDSLIDVLSTVESAEMAMMARQSGGAWKVSLRSRGRLDVGALASRLGGGGHAAAAGFTAPGPIHDLIGRVLSELEAGGLAPAGGVPPAATWQDAV